MHVRWRREAALGRSRRRPRVAVWPDGDSNPESGAGYGIWESAEVAERFAAALIFDGAAARTPRPALILLSGLPGCGKSHLARELARQAALTVISSDRVRLMLVAQPTYSDEEHEFIHGACLRLAQRGLAAQRTIVLDATNLREQHRQRFLDLAKRHQAPCHLVLLDCQEATVRARLQRRSSGEAMDGSAADGSIYDMLRETVEPVRGDHLRLRGDGDTRTAAEAVLALLRSEQGSEPSFRPPLWAGVALAGG